MLRPRFSLQFAFLAITIAAVAIWLSLPSPRIVIKINPDDSFLLNDYSFDSEDDFWNELDRAVHAKYKHPNLVPVLFLLPNSNASPIQIKTLLKLHNDRRVDVDCRDYEPASGRILTGKQS